MTTLPVPLQKIDPLLRAIAPDQAELDELARFRPAIARRRDEFAARFLEAFQRFEETRMLVEHGARGPFLLKAWAHWLDRLFSGHLDREFFGYLWGIGVRHVDVNLDQRYSNLGFALARQFCHEVLAAEAPAERLQPLCRAVDKIVDLCVLVETTAYIEASTRRDMEVIRGVADRVRTPATVIGGSLRRLQRTGGPDEEAAKLYETLLSENAPLLPLLLHQTHGHRVRSTHGEGRGAEELREPPPRPGPGRGDPGGRHAPATLSTAGQPGSHRLRHHTNPPTKRTARGRSPTLE